MAKRRMSALWTAAALLALVIFAALAALLLLQRRLIYLPQFPEGARALVWTPDAFGMPVFEHVTLTAGDGTLLECLYVPSEHSPRRDPAVLAMHGNAGNIGHRLPLVAALRAAAGRRVSVLMLSYRGYGRSQGTPSQAGMCMDARAGLAWLRDRHRDAPLVLYGQSIGGAVAFDLAGADPAALRGLIVENTFTSLPDLVPHIIPVLRWATFLLFDTWKSREKALKIAVHNSLFGAGRMYAAEAGVRRRKAASGPVVVDGQTYPGRPLRVLLLSGGRDELIPPAHMKALHTTLSRGGSEFVELREFPGGDHNSTCDEPGYFDAVAAFLARLADAED